MKININKAILSLMVLFFIVRAIFNIYFLDHNKYYWQDTIHYYSAAIEIIDNNEFGLDAERKDRAFGLEPIYSLFLSIFVLIFGKFNYLSIRIFQSIIFVLSSKIFYNIIRNFVSEKISILGLFLYLCYPFYIFFSGTILPEGIIVPTLVLFTDNLVKYVKLNKPKYLFYVAFIYAFLIHLKLVTGLLGMLLLIPFFIKKIKYIEAIRLTFISLGIVLLLSIPWGIRNYYVFGDFSLPRNYGENINQKSELSRRLEMSKKREEFKISNNFKNYFSPSLTRVDSKNKFNKPIYNYLSIIISFPLLISFILIPFIKRNRDILLLYSIFILYSLPYIIMHGQTRYRLPIDYVLIIFFLIIVQYLYLKINNKKVIN